MGRMEEKLSRGYEGMEKGEEERRDNVAYNYKSV